MKVKELAVKLNLTPISVADEDREIKGGYAGDLLSWVMGRAQAGDVWVTIMSNVNIVAVATLADVSAVVLAEGVALEEDVKETAQTRGVNVYSSPEDSFWLCGKIAEML